MENLHTLRTSVEEYIVDFDKNSVFPPNENRNYTIPRTCRELAVNTLYAFQSGRIHCDGCNVNKDGNCQIGTCLFYTKKGTGVSYPSSGYNENLPALVAFLIKDSKLRTAKLQEAASKKRRKQESDNDFRMKYSFELVYGSGIMHVGYSPFAIWRRNEDQKPFLMTFGFHDQVAMIGYHLHEKFCEEITETEAEHYRDLANSDSRYLWTEKEKQTIMTQTPP